MINSLQKIVVYNEGDRIKNHCYRNGLPANVFATLSKKECLQTCEDRMITGCEYNSVTDVCLFHTKYIIKNEPVDPPEEPGLHTCRRVERGNVLVVHRG